MVVLDVATVLSMQWCAGKVLFAQVYAQVNSGLISPLWRFFPFSTGFRSAAAAASVESDSFEVLQPERARKQQAGEHLACCSLLVRLEKQENGTKRNAFAQCRKAP